MRDKLFMDTFPRRIKKEQFLNWVRAHQIPEEDLFLEIKSLTERGYRIEGVRTNFGKVTSSIY
jgi:hypothetical protein